MRDEVFRVDGPITKGCRPRSVDLDGEVWFLLVDLMLNKGQPRALAKSPRILDQIDTQLREQVWVLEPGYQRPMALWVVSEAGRARLAEVLPSAQRRKRITASSQSRHSRPPGFPMPYIRPEEES